MNNCKSYRVASHRLDVVLLAALGAVKVGVDAAIELATFGSAHLAFAVVAAGGDASGANAGWGQVDLLLLLLAEQGFGGVGTGRG